MTSSRARSIFAAAALAVAASGSGEARAEATADQRAAAQALFDDARKLMGNKRFPEACPKLEESQRLDPGLGTLLNLAECQAVTGRTASAWANFLEAAYQAKAAGQSKRENTARTHAAALESRLSKLTILAVVPGGGARVEIKRDGAAVSASLIGTAVPVDPGEHVVTATAPGKKPWETRVTVRGEGHQFTVSVPQLEDGGETKPPEGKQPPSPEVKQPPSPEVKQPPSPEVKQPHGPPPDGSAGNGPRAAGLVLTVLGLGGIGTAAAFTFLAKNKLDTSNSAADGCDASNFCKTQQGVDDRNAARKDGNIATGAWIGGGLAAASGVGLLIAASVIKDKAGVAPAAAFVPGRGASFGLTGRF